MIQKEKIELEYLLKTSVKVFENLVTTPSGLSEWFCDDVNIKNDLYTFFWDGSEETARLLSFKPGKFIRWKWLHDEEDDLDTYFEIAYETDSMTKSLVLKITDFAEPDHTEETRLLWESYISDLKRVLGA